MTGGQPVEGGFTVPEIVRQLAAEGVSKVVVVSDEPDKYSPTAFAPGVTVHHRRELDHVQRQLRDRTGVSVLVYDQTCAAEKRRRRKRGTFPDPPKRVVINEAVCEGCGDCSTASNCLSVEPLETEFGRKRAINQSSCNKDYSCVEGFCPSFVTVHGGRLRKPSVAVAAADPAAGLPAPAVPALDGAYDIVIAGVGGTGVVTLGQLLGMAAHLEGRASSVLDFTGLAQKGGAVLSHVRVGSSAAALYGSGIAAGGARLLLGCDIVVAASFDALAKLRHGHSHAIVNAHLAPTADFTLDADARFDEAELNSVIVEATGAKAADFVDATRLATALIGDAIAANMFVLGFAVQRGLVPVGLAALERAIALNGVAVEANLRALGWGRRAAVEPGAVERASAAARPGLAPEPPATGLDDVLARRTAFLTDYQDRAYAERYRSLVFRIAALERDRVPGSSTLALAVARYYFKLLAYKDEYEVARLYTDGAFQAKLATLFEGGYTLRYHLAPPVLERRDPFTGVPRKREFGPWILSAYRVLAGLKRLRGTPFDVFGHSAERRLERRLIGEYETTLTELCDRLDPDNHALAVEIASIPERIRGFGHVKTRHLEAARAREAELLAAFRHPAPRADAAE